MRDTVNSQHTQDLYWYLLGSLVAAELLMSFSFLGYIEIKPLSITFACIPILVGGYLMGPLESTFLGMIFGLAHIWKSSASYMVDFGHSFAPFFGESPMKSFLSGVSAHALFGFLVGLLYLLAKKVPRWNLFWILFFSALARYLHSSLVYGALYILFPELGHRPMDAFKNLSTVNNIASSLFSMGIIFLVWSIQHSEAYQRFLFRIRAVNKFLFLEAHHQSSLMATVAIVSLMLVCSFMVALYFSHQISDMFQVKGYILSQTSYFDLFQLQIQFLLGMISLAFLVIVFLILNRRYSFYINIEAKMDALTGLLSRKIFLPLCTHFLGEMKFSGKIAGYFIILDVDWFKRINDLYGHPKGDQVLCAIAQTLQSFFSNIGVVGRFGGDEFVVFIHKPISLSHLEKILQDLEEQIHQIPCEKEIISCSIGVAPITSFSNVETLYHAADRYLYMAKEQGRNQFVIGDISNLQPTTV